MAHGFARVAAAAGERAVSVWSPLAEGLTLRGAGGTPAAAGEATAGESGAADAGAEDEVAAEEARRAAAGGAAAGAGEESE